jgi:anti-sigma B factor antagonist
MTDTGLEVECNECDGVVVVRIRGFLDAHTAPSLDGELRRALAGGAARVVVDLEGLTYISSAGLGVFLSYVEPLRDRGGDLRLCALLPKVQRVFDIVGFSSVFDISNDVQSALRAFTGAEHRS